MSQRTTAEPSRVTYHEVGAAEAGQRIDNYLLRILKGVPRSHVYRVLRRGEVRVNRRRARPDYRLQAGDRIRLPPVRTRPPAKPRPGRLVELLEAQIIYEDSDLIVIDKPSGVAAHGGSGISAGVIEALRLARPEETLELVHRLDRDTSGCMLVAKRRSLLRELHRLMREGQVEKRYMALVVGRWQLGSKRIAAPLRTDHRRGGERIVRVDATGKPAASEFRPIEQFQEATLMQVRLQTGRTHQIRVHAAFAGHPLAGDEKYGDAEFNAYMRTLGLRRLFLHAASIGFTRPATDEYVEFSTPLSDDLRAVLGALTAAGGRR